MISQIKKTGCAIALGGTNRVDYFVAGGQRHKKTKNRLFGDAPKLAFFVENQYPIHSYVIDRNAIDKEHFYFDSGQSRNEDYAFLLRILAQYPSDDSFAATPMCDYYINVDGGNTILAYGATATDRAKWRQAQNYVDDVKRSLIIETNVDDIRNLYEWSKDRNVNHDSAAKIQQLQADVELSDNRIKNYETMIGKLVAQLPPGNVPATVVIDAINSSRNGEARIVGWAVGRNNTPLSFLIFRSASQPDAMSVATLLPRLDVAAHIGSDQQMFGYDVTVPFIDTYDVKFIDAAGVIYESKVEMQ